VRFVIEHVITEEYNLRSFLTENAYNYLVKIDKYSNEYIDFCYALWFYEKKSAISKEIWWKDFGNEIFTSFTNCLINSSIIHKEVKKKSNHNFALIGYPHGAFGLGEDIRLVYEAMLLLDIDVRMYKAEREVIAACEEFGSFESVKNIEAVDVKIFCMPAFDTLAVLFDTGEEVFKNSYNIGLWQWELEEFPYEAKLAFDLVDEIWAISNHAAKAFRKLTNKPVYVIPLPFSLPESNLQIMKREMLNIKRNDTVFYFAFDGASFIARKNPLAVIEAFQHAFDDNNENVKLIIKTMNTQKSDLWNECIYRSKADSRIILFDKKLKRDEVYSLMHISDCVVSLHRAEGFGRIIAEALLMDKDVIVSNYSGCLDYLPSDYEYLVDGKLVDVIDGDYSFAHNNKWFQANVSIAAKHMKKVVSNKQNNVKTPKVRLERYSLEGCSKFINYRIKSINNSTIK
jgi:hypothetical protein